MCKGGGGGPPTVSPKQGHLCPVQAPAGPLGAGWRPKALVVASCCRNRVYVITRTWTRVTTGPGRRVPSPTRQPGWLELFEPSGEVGRGRGSGTHTLTALGAKGWAIWASALPTAEWGSWRAPQESVGVKRGYLGSGPVASAAVTVS